MGSLVSSVADIFGLGPTSIQAGATIDAAQTAANAQLEAARLGAEASKFTPFGVAGSAFATPKYTYDAQGRATGVDLGISPELRGYQQALSGLTSQQLQQGLMSPQQYAPLTGAASGLFNLGSQYLAETPEQAAQKYMLSQQNLLAPTRERQLAELRNRTFQTGREGLSIGGTGLRPGGGLGLSATNPEMEAYYNALAQQDAQLAAQAQEAGQRQTAFGAGLFGSGSQLLNQYQAGQTGALSPFQTSLGLQGQIENIGMTPLQVGAELGGRSATAGARAGEALMYGGLQAAKTLQPANALSPFASGLSGLSQGRLGTATDAYLGNKLSNWWESSGYGFTPQGGYAQQGQYLAGVKANPQTQQELMLAQQMAGFEN